MVCQESLYVLITCLRKLQLLHHHIVLTSSDGSFSSTGRYPNHDARKRIEEEHKEELEKLMTADGDYFHGMHSGFLAASRMFKQQADVLHINTFERGVVSEELLSAAQKHEDKIEKSRKEFPKLSVEVPPTK